MAKIISYDKENDILVAHKGFSEGERFKCNIDVGDLVLDMSTKMRIRGIEISNASSYLKEFLRLAHTRKNVLENVRDIRFSAVIKGESIAVELIIIAEMEDIRKEIPAKIAVPISSPIMR